MSSHFNKLYFVVLTAVVSVVIFLSGAAPARAGGQPPNALSFDGNFDYVDTASNVPLGGNLTYEAWVKTSGTGNWSGIISSYTPGGSGSYLQLVAQSNGTLTAQTSDTTNSYTANTTTAINDAQWHHVAVTFASATSTFHVYIDGVDQTLTGAPTGSPINPNISSKLIVGKDRSLANAGFNGTIDEVRVWNVVRSQAQIQAYRYIEVPAQAGLVVVVGSPGTELEFAL